MAKQPKLYTLTELAKETGLSLPTLQRYKKKYQSRISSVGEGRKQRYPKRAIKQIEKLKQENVAKRGRPRKRKAAKKRRKAATRKRAVKRSTRKGKKRAARRPRKATRATRKRTTGGLLTLSEIGRRTGISYPTLVRYVKLYLDQIPHEGEGRKRRYPPAAVAVFKRLRAGSRRGRPRAGTGRAASRAAVSGALARRIQKLERAQREISKSLRRIDGLLRKPLQVSIKRG